MEATISAATLAGKPVAGAKGTFKIFRITSGEDGRIEEKEVSFVPGRDGRGRRDPTEIRRTRHRSISSRRQPVLQGRRSSGRRDHPQRPRPRPREPGDWHFGPLELIADKANPRAGRNVLKLRVNSDKENANVWLFLHIAGSAGREARRIQLDGKSLEIEVPLDARDMPNMFIEGVTVFGAEVHTAVRQILLPPVSKVDRGHAGAREAAGETPRNIRRCGSP